MPVQEARVHTGGPGTKDADQEYRRLAMAYDKFTSSKSDCIASVHLLGRQNRHGAYVDRKATCEVGKTQLAMLSEQPSSNTPCILASLDKTRQGVHCVTVSARHSVPRMSPANASRSPSRSKSLNGRISMAPYVDDASVGCNTNAESQFRISTVSSKRRKTAFGSEKSSLSDSAQSSARTKSQRASNTDNTMLAFNVLSSQLWTDSLQTRRVEDQTVDEEEPSNMGHGCCSPTSNKVAHMARLKSHTIKTDPCFDVHRAVSPTAFDSNRLAKIGRAREVKDIHSAENPMPGTTTRVMISEAFVSAPNAPVGVYSLSDIAFRIDDLEEMCEQYTPLEHYDPYAKAMSPVADHERGDWRFSLTWPMGGEPQGHWTKDDLNRFWIFLKTFISGGRAGWFVTCAFEVILVERSRARGDQGSLHVNDILRQPAEPQTKPVGQGQDAVQQTFRIHCYGKVMAQVYILMHMASKGKIKRVDCSWVDTDGVVRVKVSAK